MLLAALTLEHLRTVLFSSKLVKPALYIPTSSLTNRRINFDYLQ